MRNRRARPEAPSTSQFAPKVSPTNPRAAKTQARRDKQGRRHGAGYALRQRSEPWGGDSSRGYGARNPNQEGSAAGYGAPIFRPASRPTGPRNSHRQPRKSAGTAGSAGVHTGIARERETRTDGAASSPVRVPPAPIPDGATTYRFPLPGAADAASGTPAWRPAGQGPSHREQVPEDGEPHRHRDAQRAPYEP